MFESRTQVGRLCFSYIIIIIITKSCLGFSNILAAFFLGLKQNIMQANCFFVIKLWTV